MTSFAAASATFARADSSAPSSVPPPPGAANWTLRQEPFRLFGNAYYVGTRGLSSVLITSDKGHVLIDGTLPEGAPMIADSIKALGFKIEDVKLIVNSHIHGDHAGGIPELQKMSGAKVAASAPAAESFRTGKGSPEDPQFATIRSMPMVANVSVFKDGETLKVGPIAITAHLTPGHTPGGTSWTWDSCDKSRCLHMVYADSLSTAASPGFKFSAHPDLMKTFDSSYAKMAALPCDIVVSAHPEISGLWEKLDKRDVAHDPNGLIDSHGCEKYSATLKEAMTKRLAEERASP
jgi:metallo-beta-lactamase class B